MTDNKAIINCPACHNTMSKVYVPSEGIDIDVCLEGCGGIFFDKGELFKISDDFKNIKDLRAYLEKYYSELNPVEINDEEIRICPVCKINMDKSRVANGRILMDSCGRCGGVFLDKGELEKIREIISD